MGSVPTRTRRSLSAAAVALALSVGLAACGGGSTKTSSGSSSSPTAPGGSSGGSGPGRAFPGASGQVASLSGSSMEVQGSSSQTTVSWTASTTFRQTVPLTSSSIAAGDCVTVQGSTSNGKITAQSVVVSSPSSSGTCTSGFGAGGRAGGFPGGTPPSGGNFTPPSGSASSGRVPANRGNFSFVTGKVVSVSGSSLVVNGTTAGSTTASNQTVGIGSSAKVTQDKTTASSSLAVGDCVTATGSTSSTGAVSATAVTITSTGSSSCTSGFGGFGGGAPPNQGSSSNA